MRRPVTYDDGDTCVEALLSAVGPRIVLGIPLGIGKPNRFVNALYRRVRDDSSIELRIFTALTPSVPVGRSLLERRFLEPLAERLYAGYEPLAYAADALRGALPSNIEVAEFYFSPGAYLGSDYAQQRHVSANYSHVTRALLDRGVNAVAQLIAQSPSGARRFSLGSNPDLLLDLVSESPRGRRPFLIGEISDAMPFMPNDAETAEDYWDAIIDERGRRQSAPLFAVPNKPVGLVDYAIATHAASTVEDGGTLQIGIGSLADAVAHMIRLRQTQNAEYRKLAQRLIGPDERALRPALAPAMEPFELGLYGASEMLVEGLLHLIDAGVIKRSVPAIGDAACSVVLHAAFFIGSPELYRRLKAMSEDERARIEMTGVRFVNTLTDDFAAKRDARRLARFINSAMMVTLDGAVVSDALENKRVISGVGGQHDFVAMAQRLPGARSIIALPSTRTRAGRARSNIVFDYAHTTVPRQFRDVVVTEYGAADLRGLSDRDVMVRLICVADSRFQADLLMRAQTAGKIERGYRIPDAFTRNLPQNLEERVGRDLADCLPHFPLSSDLTAAEARAAVALAYLKARAGSAAALLNLVARAPRRGGNSTQAVLQRMGLDRPRGLAERLDRRLLLAALAHTADGRPLFNT